MLVRTLTPCFVCGGYREPGDIFDFTHDGRIPECLEALEPTAQETSQEDISIGGGKSGKTSGKE